MKNATRLLTALMLLAGCKSGGDPAPSPSLAGQVQLLDEFGAKQASSGGVLVTVADLSPQVTAQSAADGSFALRGLPDGVHQLVYSKGGYGTYTVSNVPTDPQRVAPLTPVALGQVSSTLTALVDPVKRSAAGPFYGYLISGTVSPVPTAAQPRPHRLFLQRYDNVYVPLPIANNYDISLTGRTRADGTFTDTVAFAQLGAANLISVSGTNVRVWATGDNPAASPYPDPQTGKLIFPAANLPANPKTVKFYSYY